MEKEKIFVTKTPEASKHPTRYIDREMQSDASVFTEKERTAMKKYLSGVGLMGEEASIFDKARERWWYEKYGFPYRNSVARNEVIARKYAPSKEIAEAHDLQGQMLESFGRRDDNKINELKKLYQEKYPDQMEGVTILFELQRFLENQKRLNNKDERAMGHKERVGLIEEITQFRFLLSDFIAHNSGSKEFLKLFWDVIEGASKETGGLSISHQLRKSTLSQVAIFKIFEALGKKPVLSHPREDAFEAIDLWTDEESAVQVKGGSEKLLIAETEATSFPGVEIRDGERVSQFDTDMSRTFSKFKAKISKYGSLIGRDLRGYMIAIPYSKFDFVTGEPSEEVIRAVRETLDAKKEMPLAA